MLSCANFMKERISAQTKRGCITQQEELWQALLLFVEHDKDTPKGHTTDIFSFVCLVFLLTLNQT